MVVRVDMVVYVLVTVIAILALVSVIWPGRVDLALIASLGTLMGSVLAGWLAYMRRGKAEPEDEGDDAPSCR